MTKEGYVAIEEILDHKTFKSNKITKENIFDIVDNNDKKRFE